MTSLEFANTTLLKRPRLLRNCMNRPMTRCYIVRVTVLVSLHPSSSNKKQNKLVRRRGFDSVVSRRGTDTPEGPFVEFWCIEYHQRSYFHRWEWRHWDQGSPSPTLWLWRDMDPGERWYSKRAGRQSWNPTWKNSICEQDRTPDSDWRSSALRVTLISVSESNKSCSEHAED